LDVASGATVTYAGTSLDFKIGNGGVGRCVLRGGAIDVPNAAYSYISASGSDQGTLQGWGSFNLNNKLCMPWTTAGAALVIADGFGTDHTLAVNYSELLSKGPSPARTNGWYARNSGKLLLSPIPVSGDGVKYWGGASPTDLVNTVTWDFLGVTGSGNLTGSLYAVDHGDAPPAAGGSKVVGIWEFAADGFTFTNAAITIRYDAARAVALGLAESDLHMYRYEDPVWVLLASEAVDTGSKLIEAGSVAELGFFALGDLIVRPGGSVFLIR
jgi:hypothetical protein